jgi:hypothetical protein
VGVYQSSHTEPYDGDRDDEEELYMEMLESKRACSFLVQKQDSSSRLRIVQAGQL